jgi:hypothetical protein
MTTTLTIIIIITVTIVIVFFIIFNPNFFKEDCKHDWGPIKEDGYQYCIKCNLAHLVPTLESPKCEHVWEIEKQSQIQRRNPGATGVLADIGTETTYICKKCTTRKYVRLELNEDPLVQFI